MTASAVKPMHLPWHQFPQYWLCVLPRDGSIPDPLVQRLNAMGMHEIQQGAAVAYAMPAPREWGARWQEVCRALAESGAENLVEGAVLAGDDAPDIAQIVMGRRPCAEIKAISESLWLGDALLSNSLLCYVQPVVSGRDASGRDKLFGYESFMRSRQPDGKIVGGAAIVEASRALSLQYAVDRHMHVQAIKSFVQGQLTGSLFINFIPGFIQRPEVYLEGLTEAVRAFGVVPRQIVLDVTHSESPHDVQHIKRIGEYCRSKGYAVALDDVESLNTARSMLESIHPEFVKLEAHLVQRVEEMGVHDMVHNIVSACHASGAMVLAEGVETESVYMALKALEVDLFQGYYFSPPVPVEQLSRAE